MFTWLNKQGVQSDEGFIVQRVDRFIIEYQEGPRKVSVGVEPGFSGGPRVIIGKDAFARWDNGISIPPSNKRECTRISRPRCNSKTWV